jgi:hypothetical protein
VQRRRRWQQQLQQQRSLDGDDGRELHGHGGEQSVPYTDASCFLAVATSLLRSEHPVVAGLGLDP